MDVSKVEVWFIKYLQISGI